MQSIHVVEGVSFRNFADMVFWSFLVITIHSLLVLFLCRYRTVTTAPRREMKQMYDQWGVNNQNLLIPSYSI